MMWKWIGSVLCLLIIVTASAPPLGAAENTIDEIAATPAQKRLVKILTGRSDSARTQLLAHLQAHPQQLDAHLHVIIAAAEDLLADHAGEVAAAEALPDDPGAEGSEEPLPVPATVSQVLRLLARSPREEARAVITQSLDHVDTHVAMVAMDVIGEFQIELAIDDLVMQIKRPAFDAQYAYRFALVRALARLHCPRSIEWLQRLEEQLDGQLHHEIQDRLANVDLQDFDGDPEQLLRYRQQLDDDAMMGPARLNANPNHPVSTRTRAEPQTKPASAVTSSRPGGLQLQDAPSESQGKLRLSNGHYYGIELNAGRMLFIIDRSGSMRRPAYHETRLQSAKRELVRVIENLAPQAEFAIMLFDTQVYVWRDELLLATEENKDIAIEFVKRISWGDRTNTHGVLRESLRFNDQLEAVFMLTDGRPTEGAILMPQAIIQDIVERNRMRHLQINTIGIGVNPVTTHFLQTLAEETGGEFRRVD
ncbi:VWA domain-containing protein [Allorhodopirellula solitaria]|uniref:von Willebrand factor type A domain protein n=1 Tax=Allorhodopirellula solitaria TaxID=2527987 RepID=A0A5C5XVK5_9BACT|nr:VWA domain-containing protein [Allorhodopirellula solitaria]TWT66025.1 von Willebrand factor type A domain protein [Allorhodopirellula solitaria]